MRRSSAGVLLAVLVVSLSMRGPIIAVSPVVGELRSALGAGPAALGLLTTVPVLCFGLATPLALLVVRRLGLNRTVLAGLAGTLAGVAMRSSGGFAAVLIGTLVMGAGITIGNVVMPVIIGRDFAGRTTGVTAAYSSALNVGSMIATTTSAPLALLAGWRLALGAWGLVALLGGLVWWLLVLRRPADAGTGSPPAPDVLREVAEDVGRQPPGASPGLPQLWRRPLVAGMVLAFAGQSFSYYGISAWLPSLLRDELGLTTGAAGASSSIFQILALAGAFAVPALVAARLPARAVLLVVCSFWIVMPLGLAIAPALWPVWSACGGAAQGGGFTVIFSVIAGRAADVHDGRRMSAAVQGVGYCVGATGPLAVAAAHTLTAGWVAPMLVVSTAIVVMAVAGSIAIGSGSPDRREQAGSAAPAGRQSFSSTVEG